MRETTFQVLAQALGERDALALIERMGGQRHYFAANGKPSEYLTRVLGDELARRVAARMAGEQIAIPRAPEPRRIAIRRLQAAGMDAGAIALKVGCTRRYAEIVMRE